jgi:hypothetical protein
LQFRHRFVTARTGPVTIGASGPERQARLRRAPLFQAEKTTVISTLAPSVYAQHAWQVIDRPENRRSAMPRFNNILETIGNTPLVKLQKLAPAGCNVYVKVESFNPMGSVKDRMARAVIERAEKNGDLQPGQTVIEATSGNTGITNLAKGNQ